MGLFSHSMCHLEICSLRLSPMLHNLPTHLLRGEYTRCNLCTRILLRHNLPTHLLRGGTRRLRFHRCTSMARLSPTMRMVMRTGLPNFSIRILLGGTRVDLRHKLLPLLHQPVIMAVLCDVVPRSHSIPTHPCSECLSIWQALNIHTSLLPSVY